ncbi:hypothetical protein CVT24_007524 [Panaeolus cyanescens]|uniref:C2H2-type domain-containing protein n=1 Tax=Panaeolus cyanescens TaxID=181874 RepID=A0A409YL80_9AGAR|nr:hypothetical protein CVT24_007524 [Panaeolus cyanescens]
MTSSTFRDNVTWFRPSTGSHGTGFRDYMARMATDDESRPPTPLHISPPLSCLRGTANDDIDNESTESDGFRPSSSSSSSSGEYVLSRHQRPTSAGTSSRSREGVMRLESILNDVSVDPSYALWVAADRRRQSTEPVSTAEDAHVDSRERAGSEGATMCSGPDVTYSETESEVSSNNGGSGPNKRAHRCTECGKAFPRPSGLRTHMSIHTKEKPFVCVHPGCGRTFSVASNARRHMRLHGIGLDPETSSPEQLSPLKVDFEQPIVVEPPRGGSVGIEGPRRLKWSSSRVKTSGT